MKKSIRCFKGEIKEMNLEQVIQEFKNLLHSKEIMKWTSCYEVDDLIQIGYMGLMKAYIHYDISKNMSFISYAQKVIQDVIINTYKKDKRQKRGGNVEICSIYSIIDDTEGLEMIATIEDENCNCEESALNNIVNEKINKVIKTFSKQDQEMIYLYFIKGLNQTEIGIICNKTRACISYRIKQIINKLRTQLISEVS